MSITIKSGAKYHPPNELLSNGRTVTVNTEQSMMPEGPTDLEEFIHTYQNDGSETLCLTIASRINRIES